eukprot:GHVS01011939.1.p1 GENE.GHVS01011939.1~~GHVS01011939.1.p1  ORF type:complete len:479 (-),score=140.64 GHVS01011939.1:172-1500(-)
MATTSMASTISAESATTGRISPPGRISQCSSSPRSSSRTSPIRSSVVTNKQMLINNFFRPITTDANNTTTNNKLGNNQNNNDDNNRNSKYNNRKNNIHHHNHRHQQANNVQASNRETVAYANNMSSSRSNRTNGDRSSTNSSTSRYHSSSSSSGQCDTSYCLQTFDIIPQQQSRPANPVGLPVVVIEHLFFCSPVVVNRTSAIIMDALPPRSPSCLLSHHSKHTTYTTTSNPSVVVGHQRPCTRPGGTKPCSRLFPASSRASRILTPSKFWSLSLPLDSLWSFYCSSQLPKPCEHRIANNNSGGTSMCWSKGKLRVLGDGRRRTDVMGRGDSCQHHHHQSVCRQHDDKNRSCCCLVTTTTTAIDYNNNHKNYVQTEFAYNNNIDDKFGCEIKNTNKRRKRCDGRPTDNNTDLTTTTTTPTNGYYYCLQLLQYILFYTFCCRR